MLDLIFMDFLMPGMTIPVNIILSGVATMSVIYSLTSSSYRGNKVLNKALLDVLQFFLNSLKECL